MKKQKIIEYLGSLSTGGAESLIRDYGIELQKRGDEVLIPVLYDDPDSPIQKAVQDAGIRVDVIRGRLNRGFLLRCWNKLRTITGHNGRYLKRALKTYRPDVLHMHGYTLVDLKHIRKELKGVRILYTCHNPPAEFFSGRWKGQLKIAKRLIKDHSMQMIALHRQMADELNALFEIDNTVVLHNPIDVKRFAGCTVDRAQKRAALGIPQDAFVVGNVGRFTAQKNQLFLLEVFQEVHRRRPESVLLMIGGSDGELLDDIRQRIGELQLTECCKLLFDRADMDELYGIMDCFVMPSIFEGFGISLIEVQAAGVRCVVSDRITPEVLLSENAVVLDLQEPVEKWAEHICAKVGGERRSVPEQVLERFDITHIVDQLQALYRA